MTFDRLMRALDWKPIAHCPGRFVLATPGDLTPPDLVGPDVELGEFTTVHARDPVIVGRFADGGLISYRRADRRYVHTLNTPEGFERKLRQLGLETTLFVPQGDEA
jgi:hypothetical protein